MERIRPQSPVALTVTSGYDEQYRAYAWVPVRVTLHNRGSAVLSGTVAVPDLGDNSQVASMMYTSLYQAPVVLAPGTTKRVTLYVPGQDIGDQITVNFQSDGRTVASATDAPSNFDDQTISVGTLAKDVGAISWLNSVRPQNTNVATAHLNPALLDPVPGALANFDMIVLSNTDTSVLSALQRAALEQYVRAGGSLILIGGPDWQETLRPLPRSLIPGQLVGSQVIHGLSALQALAGLAPPRQSTVVTRLIHPQGTVLASQDSIPLAVRDPVGRGRVLYLAFDPSVDFFPHWRGTTNMMSDLVEQAGPDVVSRLAASGWQSVFFTGRYGPSTIRDELSNVPSATQSSLLLLVFLTVASTLILGPLNFLLMHRLGRQELAWVTVPALAVFGLGSTLAIAAHFRDNTVLLNTIGVVDLDTSGDVHPASLYIGLFSSQHGDYRLVWNGPALPQGLPEYSFDQTSAQPTAPLGYRLQEGAQTAVDFPGMAMWSTRSVALSTTVTIPGTVRANLHLAPDGSIVGVVANDTNLTLIRPLIIAGSAFLRLADLPPKSSSRVRIRPRVDLHADSSIPLWDQVYGSSSLSPDFDTWDGDPWEEPQASTERTLTDRLRNVAERLPETRNILSWGEVVFVAWNQSPLGSLSVDGVTPMRRDLNLIIRPLSIHLTPGTFTLRPGTIGAYLIDDRPQAPQDGCCVPPYPTQTVALGPGGSATFQFDIPDAHHVHFRRLRLLVNAGDAQATDIGTVYNWRTGKWVHVNLESGVALLPNPDRFVSPAGALLIRLRADQVSGDVVIDDPHQDIQLTGFGKVS